MGQCNLTEAATRYVYYCRSAFQDCIDLFSVPVSFLRVSAVKRKKKRKKKRREKGEKKKKSASRIPGLKITKRAQYSILCNEILLAERTLLLKATPPRRKLRRVRKTLSTLLFSTRAPKLYKRLAKLRAKEIPSR